MEYNVIWIDDECKSRMGDLFIQRCEKYGVHIEPFEYGIDGLDAFEEDLNRWHAIIFDAKMLYRPGTPDTAHLYEARDRLNSLNLKKYIPSYILTAQPGLMSSEDFAKSVRCKVFNKLDLKANRSFTVIMETVHQGNITILDVYASTNMASKYNRTEVIDKFWDYC